MSPRGRRIAATLSILGIALSGCATIRTESLDPTGLFLHVINPFSVPKGRARALFQDGRQVDRVDGYRPYCEFELDTVAPQAQSVPVGRIAVVRRSQRVVADEQSGFPAGPMSVFRCDLDHFYESMFWLHADHQRNVRMLICRDWRMSCSDGRHLTLDEILTVLGPTFVLD